MNRTAKWIAVGAGVGLVGYLVWREKQRTQAFPLSGGYYFAFTVQGIPRGAPASVASVQAVFAAQGLPLTVTGVTVQNTTPPTFVITGATLGPVALSGGQIAAAVGVTGGTFTVSGGQQGAVLPQQVSSLVRARRRLLAVR